MFYIIAYNKALCGMANVDISRNIARCNFGFNLI